MKIYIREDEEIVVRHFDSGRGEAICEVTGEVGPGMIRGSMRIESIPMSVLDDLPAVIRTMHDMPVQGSNKQQRKMIEDCDEMLYNGECNGKTIAYVIALEEGEEKEALEHEHWIKSSEVHKFIRGLVR